MPSRYIPHPQSPPSDLDATRKEIYSALLMSIQKVRQNRGSGFSGAGIYIGRTGRALMHYHLSSLAQMIPVGNLEATTLKPLTLLADGDNDLFGALLYMLGDPKLWKIRDDSHISYLETNVGVATLALLRTIQGSDYFIDHWRSCEELLRSSLRQIISAAQYSSSQGEQDEDGCELLYGRAGFLYALVQIRYALLNNPNTGSESSSVPMELIRSLKSLTSDDNISAVVGSIIRRGQVGAQRYATDVPGKPIPPLMWSWHMKRYLGAAHGVAGILQVLWNCPLHIIASYIPDMLGTVEWLLGCIDSSGNWPTKAPEPSDHGGDNELVHWCHGAPGILILLATVLQKSLSHPQQVKSMQDLYEKIVAALRLGAELVYRHGLLRKGVGLCHGISGSVFSLLAVSDILDSLESSRTLDEPHNYSNNSERAGKYLKYATHLAHLATSYESFTSSGKMSIPDRPLSLYEGLAGMCCAWAEIICRLSGGAEGQALFFSGMPGYGDFHK